MSFPYSPLSLLILHIINIINQPTYVGPLTCPLARRLIVRWERWKPIVQISLFCFGSQLNHFPIVSVSRGNLVSADKQCTVRQQGRLVARTRPSKPVDFTSNWLYLSLSILCLLEIF